VSNGDEWFLFQGSSGSGWKCIACVNSCIPLLMLAGVARDLFTGHCHPARTWPAEVVRVSVPCLRSCFLHILEKVLMSCGRWREGRLGRFSRVATCLCGAELCCALQHRYWTCTESASKSWRVYSSVCSHLFEIGACLSACIMLYVMEDVGNAQEVLLRIR